MPPRGRDHVPDAYRPAVGGEPLGVGGSLVLRPDVSSPWCTSGRRPTADSCSPAHPLSPEPMVRRACTGVVSPTAGCRCNGGPRTRDAGGDPDRAPTRPGACMRGIGTGDRPWGNTDRHRRPVSRHGGHTAVDRPPIRFTQVRRWSGAVSDAFLSTHDRKWERLGERVEEAVGGPHRVQAIGVAVGMEVTEEPGPRGRQGRGDLTAPRPHEQSGYTPSTS